MEQVFVLHYIGKYSNFDISNMPIHERTWILTRLSEQKKREEKLEQQAQGFQEVRHTK